MRTYQSKISGDRASEISGLATNRGIEHEMFSSGNSVVFEFNNPRTKKAFDRLCMESGVVTDSDRIVNLMIDDVLAGAGPSEALDEARKKMSITYGMARHMGKGKAKYLCPNCSLTIPVYSGAYPSKCPSCGGDLSSADEMSS
jgi:hypothetical protein